MNTSEVKISDDTWYSKYLQSTPEHFPLKLQKKCALELVAHRDYIRLHSFLEAYPQSCDKRFPVEVLRAGGGDEYQKIVTHLALETDSFRKELIEAAILGGNSVDLVAELLHEFWDHGRSFEFYVNLSSFWGLALRRGDPIVINLLTALLPSDIKYLNQALIQATRIGDLKWVTHFISRGANDFEQAILEALRNKHTTLVHLFLMKGARNYGDMLIEALKRSPEWVERILGMHKCSNHKEVLVACAEMGNLKELVRFLPGYSGRLDEVFRMARNKDHQDVAAYLLQNHGDRFQIPRGK